MHFFLLCFCSLHVHCVCFRLGNTMDVLQSLWQLIARPADSDELHIINLTLKTNNLTSSSTGTPTADHIWLQQTLSNIRMTFLPLVASCFFLIVFFSPHCRPIVFFFVICICQRCGCHLYIYQRLLDLSADNCTNVTWYKSSSDVTSLSLSLPARS